MAQSIWPMSIPDNTVGGETQTTRTGAPHIAIRRRHRKVRSTVIAQVLIAGAYSAADRQLARTARQAARAALDGGVPVAAQHKAPRIARPQLNLRAASNMRFAAHSMVLILVLFALFVRSLPPELPALADQSASSTSRSALAQALPPGAEGIVPVAHAPMSAAVSAEMALPERRTSSPNAEAAFLEYHVLQEGESLGDVAQRYGIDVASLFWANDLQGDTLISAGHELRIPRLAGMPYIIQPEDTLVGIAEHFHVPIEAITLFRANALNLGMTLPVGQEIFVPGATQAYPEELLKQVGGEAGIAKMRAVITGSVYENKTNLRAGPGRSYPRVAYLKAGIHLKPIARHEQWVKVDAGSEGSGWVRADMIALSEATFNELPMTNDFPPLPPRWIWPSAGAFTSSFGWRTSPFRSFHNGIDIANRAGTPVVAARDGRVVQAGWCSGYGYCVRISHGGGIETTYGHLLRKPSVAAGDDVEAGDLIGLMGSTYDRAGGGYSTGVHLHFTLKINGEAVNPMKYLP